LTTARLSRCTLVWKIAMHVLLRKLKALHLLSAEEEAAILSAITDTRDVRRGETIASDGSQPNHSTLVVRGIACRYKNFADGRRQILSFQYPGDITDLYSYVLKRLDHGVAALTAGTISKIPHEAIQSLCEKFPNLAYALWRDSLVDTSKLHSSIMSLGTRTSKERLAHFLAEQYVRLMAVRLIEPGQNMDFGITQNDLADATGLSLVHVNKTLKKLKDDGLVSWNRNEMKILNWEALKQAALFDPTYLHFKNVHV
jgi:CRP-like cAMP-binding protein